MSQGEDEGIRGFRGGSEELLEEGQLVGVPEANG